MLRPTGRRSPNQDRSTPDIHLGDPGVSIAADHWRISGLCNECGETNHVTQTSRHEQAVS